MIEGQGEETDRIVSTLDLSDGGYRQECFIDGSSKSYHPDKQTIEEYREMLRQMAVEKAQNFVSISNVEFDAVAKYAETLFLPRAARRLGTLLFAES